MFKINANIILAGKLKIEDAKSSILNWIKNNLTNNSKKIEITPIKV